MEMMIKNEFSENLIDWYHGVKRDLPWRKNADPYRIWVSEIMLQQTQVATVIGYFNRFMERFPTVESLANADEAEVFKLWEGLGYYSRARNLMRCASFVVSDYGGVFPSEPSVLIKLPGIGPYTAGAISSIAFNKKSHAVDGNVMRVVSRYMGIDADIALPKSKKCFEEVVMQLMGGEPRYFNQALMELGATVCSPTSPKCHVCPVRTGCIAFKQDIVEKLPVKSKKMKQKHQYVNVLLIYNDGKYLVVKRPNAGLMANLWGFPVYLSDKPGAKERDILDSVEEIFGIKIKIEKIETGKKHVFTHLVWHVSLCRCILMTGPPSELQVEYPENLWLNKDEFTNYAFPTAFKKQFDVI